MGWDDLIGCIGYNTPLHFERSMLGLNISENRALFRVSAA